MADGWLRIGVLHHNLVRGPENDDENLKDLHDLKRILAPSLNLVLHGHTHFGALNWLNQYLPAISTGSAGLGRDARPEETPNQYQIVQLFPNRFVRYARCYNPVDKRWEGDNRCSDDGNDWQTEQKVPFQHVHAVWPEGEPWGQIAGPKTKGIEDRFRRRIGEPGRRSRRGSRGWRPVPTADRLLLPRGRRVPPARAGRGPRGRAAG